MSQTEITRRKLFTVGAGAAAAACLSGSASSAEPVAKAARKGRINQSLCQWCWNKSFDFETLCKHAVDLGCGSIELAAAKDWPTLKKHGLICALTGSHGFTKGMNNPKNWDECIAKMRTSIDNTAAAGFPNVITFTGFREGISDEDGIKNCVEGYKKIVGYAEEKKVTLCLEMLNSKVAENMKGHPGYQGDHVDYVMEILRKVGSPRLKLLFDVYHVQIMDGDIITRIKQNAEAIAHVHTAGNPGRCELDDTQEINYRAVMKALLDVGYKGWVGQEFIPTRDALAGLREAVGVCDV